MGRIRRCANCGRTLKREEVAAQYNDEWFVCFPCWDMSEGFIGWQVGTIADVEVLDAEPRRRRSRPRAIRGKCLDPAATRLGRLVDSAPEERLRVTGERGRVVRWEV